MVVVGRVVLTVFALVGARGTDVTEAPAPMEQPSLTPPVPLVSPSYGVDVSFPIHGPLQPGTFQEKRYADYMAGCYKRYDKWTCDASERSRQRLNLAQPPTQQVRVPSRAAEPRTVSRHDQRERERERGGIEWRESAENGGF